MTQLFEQHKHTIVELLIPSALKINEPLNWLQSEDNKI